MAQNACSPVLRYEDMWTNKTLCPKINCGGEMSETFFSLRIMDGGLDAQSKVL